jgi:hypothetical protein
MAHRFTLQTQTCFPTLQKSYLTDRKCQVRYQEEYTKLYTIQSGVPQDSILGPLLYSVFTGDLPETEQTLTATYTDDTAILASHQNPITASRKLQNHLNQFEKWLVRWRTKASENESTWGKKENCLTVTLTGNQIPQGETARYLGIYEYLDRRLTWRTHIFAKRKQLGMKFQLMYWILGRKSELSIENKLLIYKTILKSIWTYGIPLWGTASNSDTEILNTELG